MVKDESSAMLEDEALVETPGLEGADLAAAKVAFSNSIAVQKANWDAEVANKEVRTIVIPSASRMGQRDPGGVAPQVNGTRFPRIALDTPVEVPNSIADIIEGALAGEKVAIQREADFASGKLVIPIGGI